MEIAILSMQRIVNFGSVLQAYSLRAILRELTDARICFLDIEDDPFLESRPTLPELQEETPDYPPGLLQRGKRWLIARLSDFNKAGIRRFMAKELGVSERANQSSFDYVIVGSDEVFNHAKGIRLQLHGLIPQGRKQFTYAASCGSAGLEGIDPKDVPRIQEAMRRFGCISVRDEATERYVKGLYAGPVEHHLDPVLVGPLRDRAHKPVRLKNYLLVYAYGQRINSKAEIEAIRGYARMHGLKVAAVGGSQFWCDLYVPASPMRLLDYFYDADCVVTDTFHGSIFSIINQKRFAVISRRSNRNKLTALMKDLKLEDRLLPDMEALDAVLSRPIDYAVVNAILEQERRRSRAYLKRMLEP